MTVTAPSGTTSTLSWRRANRGFGQRVLGKRLGLWRATDGKLNALINIGPANPREFTEVTSTTEVLSPIAAATGGYPAGSRGNSNSAPRVLAVHSGRHL